jgi:hypothetical protein
MQSIVTAFLALVIIRSSAHERLMLYCPPTMYRWFVSSEVGHGVVNSGYYVPRSGVGSSARGLKPEGSSVAASSLDLRTLERPKFERCRMQDLPPIVARIVVEPIVIALIVVAIVDLILPIPRN